MEEQLAAGVRESLAELREAVEQARQMPMSASVMINRAELVEIVGRVEAAVERALTAAQEVVGERHAVVAQGEEEAAEVLRRAQAERDKLVSDTDVYRLATERADEITAEARRAADELRAETEQYVESHLANFELTLERTLETVRRGRARLTEGHTSGLGEAVADTPDLPADPAEGRGQPA